MIPISIDRKADVPVGVQLGWALSAQIRDGTLAPGQRLPTLRELAEATGLNVNTVRAVYRRLEQGGLIESQHGSGTFVAASPRHAIALGSIAANAAQEARDTGLDPREVAAALYVAPDEAHEREAASAEPAGAGAEAARRRALRAQIAGLERMVTELEAEHPGVAPAPRRSRRGIGPALLTLDELAAVRATLIRRLTIVQSAIDEHVERQRREHAVGHAGAASKASARAKVRAGAGSEPDADARPEPGARPEPSARPEPGGARAKPAAKPRRPRARPAPASG